MSSGSIVAFENHVDFEVEMVKGVKNVLFSGEGLFMTRLEGPGRVWLSSLPFDFSFILFFCSFYFYFSIVQLFFLSNLPLSSDSPD